MLESRALHGAVAQLGERRVRNAKVEGSIPFRSTNPLFRDDPKWSPAPFTSSGKQALSERTDLPTLSRGTGLGYRRLMIHHSLG